MGNVVVFGHKGMVGSAVLRTVPEDEVVVGANLSRKKLIELDSVTDFLLSVKAQSVIMCSAVVGGILANSLNQGSFLLDNLKLQNSIIEASKRAGVENFLFLGSSCAYPKYATQPIKEASLLAGALETTNEGYAIAKIAGIKLCEFIHKETKRNFFSLMPTNLYGPNDNYHPLYSHVPAGLMRRFHEAKIGKKDSVTIWGTGSPLREFMHVDDLARACWHFLKKENRGAIINIGTGSEISIKEFAYLVASITRYEGKIIFDTSKPDGAQRKLLNLEIAHAQGWQHKIGLDEGLKATYDWFESNYRRGSIRGFSAEL
jgi:GDP-L-fucose synthase